MLAPTDIVGSRDDGRVLEDHLQPAAHRAQGAPFEASDVTPVQEHFARGWTSGA